jgi:hypothetical protein
MGAIKEMIARVGMDGSGFEIGAKKVESAAARMSHTVNHHIKGMVIGFVGVAALEQLSHKTIEYGAHIADMANRLGIGTEALQEFGFAAQQNGSSLDAMATFIEKVSVARDKALGGDKKSKESLARLGISDDDLKTVRNEGLVKTIGEAIKGGDIQKLIAPLREVGGRGAGELVAAFKKGLAEMGEEARHIGIIINDDTIKKLKLIEDELSVLGRILISDMAPSITYCVDKIYDLVDSLHDLGTFLGSLSGNPKFSISNFIKSLGETPKHPEGMSWWDKLWSTPIKDQSTPALNALSGAIDQAIQDVSQNKSKRPSLTLPPKLTGDFTATHPANIKPEKEDKFTTEKLSVDALTKMGGFVGGAETIMVTIAKDSLKAAKETAANTKAMINKLDNLASDTEELID